MKKILAMVLTIVMLLSLASVSAYADEKIKLQFMGWEASAYETEANKAAIAAFEAANPEYEVEFITGKYDDHHTRLMTMMAGNAAPDVFYMEPNFSRAFSDQGLLLNIADIYEKDFKDVKLIDWSYQKTSSDDGKCYGIDSCIVGSILYVNPELFRAAGLEIPSTSEAMTWDEFVSVAQKLTLKDGDVVTQYGVYGFDDWAVAEAYLYYNVIFSSMKLVCLKSANPERAAEILETLKSLRTVYGVAPEAAFIENSGMNANQLLKTGKVAMVMQGSFSTQELSKMGFEFIAVKPPVLDEKHPVGILHSSYNCAIWSGTKHPEAAKTLASFLCSEDAQLVFVRDGLWMTNRDYLYEPENWDKWLSHDVYPEGFEDLIPMFRKGNFRPSFGVKNANEVTDVLVEEYQNYLFNGQSVENTFANMTTRANKIMSR